MRAVLPAEMSPPPSSPPPPGPWSGGWLRAALRALLWTSAGLALLVGGLALNLRLARWLLHFEDRAAPLERIARWKAPVARPLVLSTPGYDADSPLRRTFLRSFGLSEAAAARLPAEHRLAVSADTLSRTNPYPPLLAEGRGPLREWLLFGYLDRDGRYHQITHYAGECDTNPSILLRKVRGRRTGHGDYFVSYTLYGSKDPRGTPIGFDPETGREVLFDPRLRDLDLDRLEWSSYEGGTYDGLEEAGFTFAATGAEALALGFLATALGARRRRSNVGGTGGPLDLRTTKHKPLE